MFQDRTFVIGLGCGLLIYAGPPAFAMISSIFLQKGLGYSPRATGLLFAPFCIAFLAASFSAIGLATRLGSRVINLGLALMSLGLAGILILIGADVVNGHLTIMMIPMTVYGLGQGLVMPTLVRTVLSNVSHDDVGSASGVFTTMQQVSMLSGVATIGSIFFSLVGPDRDYTHATIISLLINLALLLLSFWLVFYLPHAASEEVEVVAE